MRLSTTVLLAACCFFAGRTIAHGAMPQGREAVYRASLLVWCGSSYRACRDGVHAYRVAGCETGGTYDRWARNGQYHGLWQMGSYERSRCGQVWGRDPWTQARAAHCWWRATGTWYPTWSCG